MVQYEKMKERFKMWEKGTESRKLVKERNMNTKVRWEGFLKAGS
jgi:hypothetical protein